MHFVTKPQQSQILVDNAQITSTTDNHYHHSPSSSPALSPHHQAARMLKRTLSSMVDFDNSPHLSSIHHSHHLAMDDLDDHFDQIHHPSKKSKGMFLFCYPSSHFYCFVKFKSFPFRNLFSFLHFSLITDHDLLMNV